MSTTAKLTYSVPPTDGSRHFTTLYDDVSIGGKLQSWTPDIRTVEITDVRGKEREYTLDNNGFEFHHYPSKHTRFVDDGEIKVEYYPETAAFVKKMTGAKKVFMFDHGRFQVPLVIISTCSRMIPLAVRRRRPGSIETPEDRRPVAYVHVDRTPTSSIARVRRHFPPEEAEELLKGRVQVVNLWRPLTPAHDWPMAFCDYRSIDPKRDVFPSTLAYKDHDGYNMLSIYHPNHRWYYKSGMMPNDLVMIKMLVPV